MTYDFNAIPNELKRIPQWIVWKKEEREGKFTKVPYQVNGEMAQSNNRRSWSTFNTAVHYFNTGGYDGIGFMFSKDDPYIGIDIDHCVKDGKFSLLAEEIIEMLDSYTELSPSGDGVHIIVKGELPIQQGTGKKNPELGLEIYRNGRYFTFTGHSKNVKEVVERTEELALLFQKYLKEKELPVKPSTKGRESTIGNLSNSELWERMFNAKNSGDIKALFDGDYGDDHSSADLALMNHLAFWTNKDRFKMDSMFRESGLMRDKWDEKRGQYTYGEMTIDRVIRTTSYTIADFEEEQYNITIHNNPEEFELPQKSFMRTELGNAERIVYQFGKDIRHVDEVGWFIWDGKRWIADKKKEIEKIASKVLRQLFKGDEDDRKWAKVCEKRSIRMNSIKDMIPMVSSVRDEFDKQQFLFNCSNGILDLTTGMLLPHGRSYMMTKLSNVEFNKETDCPNWKAFLESIFKDAEGNTDYEVIDFMQKAIGYALTGDISEQVMFFLYGNGRNGKSTFINIIQNLLGDYAKQTNSDTFIKKSNDSGINNDIARLYGARFVSAVESEDGQKLSESLVKQITGGEKILARFLRQEFFEYDPTFKVFFTTNHKPIIHGIDDGIWRRVRLIPFTVTIPKEKVDKQLPKKLTTEMPGILNWALDGCLKWQQEGLGEPQAITSATNEYKENMDILEPFLFEKCIKNPLAKIEAKELFNEYQNWCFENGELELKNRAFYRTLEAKGYKRERGNQNKFFVNGIGLREESYKFLQVQALKSNKK